MTSTFTSHDAISIVQLIFFTFSLLAAILLCVRHSFSRRSGFLILITFSILRLLGASFRLATIHYSSRSVYGGAIICEAVGLSPLTALNLGLLGRANRLLPEGRRVPMKVFGVISIASLAGIGLAVKGGVDAAEKGEPNTLVKMAVVLFLAVYSASAVIFGFLVRQREMVPAGERRVLVCFAVCAPLIMVRLVHALFGDFGNDARFSVFSGNVVIWLCMAVLEEIICVAVVIVVGLTLKKITEPEPEQEQEQEQASGSEDVEVRKGEIKTGVTRISADM